MQPLCTPFPIWNQSFVLCLVLTVASWPAYRFHRRKVRWSGIPILNNNEISPQYYFFRVAMYLCVRFSSVSQSYSTLQARGLQHARLPCPSPCPEAAQTLIHWINDAIQDIYTHHKFLQKSVYDLYINNISQIFIYLCKYLFPQHDGLPFSST